ncbi:zinc-binding dehydrogenase [Achromobacter xylosoxidans]
MDVVASRLELAKELGATHTVNSKEEDVVEAVREITNGGADFALESTGRWKCSKPASMRWAGWEPWASSARPNWAPGQFRHQQPAAGRSQHPRHRRGRQRSPGLHPATGQAVPAGPLPIRPSGEVLSAGADQPGR